MPTRMERYYYRSNADSKRRTVRNEELYKTIYENGEYSNIEGITSIGSTNEIDLAKLKQMLKSREEYQKEKDYRGIVKREKPVEIPVIEEEDDRTYDIRDILTKAKTERSEDVNKDHNLKNTQYNILKNLNLKDINTSLEKENQELKELINTITSTSMLNKIQDADVDLFDDLKSTNTSTMVANTSVQDIIKKEKEEDTKEMMDKSFFTSSLGINEKDFQDFEDAQKEKSGKRKIAVKRVLLALFILIVILVNIFFLSHYAI